MKRSMRPLAGLLCLFLQVGLSSGRAADALDQWTSEVFPKDSHFSSMPGATFGADVIIGGTSFLAAGVVSERHHDARVQWLADPYQLAAHQLAAELDGPAGE